MILSKVASRIASEYQLDANILSLKTTGVYRIELQFTVNSISDRITIDMPIAGSIPSSDPLYSPKSPNGSRILRTLVDNFDEHEMAEFDRIVNASTPVGLRSIVDLVTKNLEVEFSDFLESQPDSEPVSKPIVTGNSFKFDLDEARPDLSRHYRVIQKQPTLARFDFLITYSGGRTVDGFFSEIVPVYFTSGNGRFFADAALNQIRDRDPSTTYFDSQKELIAIFNKIPEQTLRSLKAKIAKQFEDYYIKTAHHY